MAQNVTLNIGETVALAANEHEFSTTYEDGSHKVGYYVAGRLTVDGKVYQAQVQMIELRPKAKRA